MSDAKLGPEDQKARDPRKPTGPTSASGVGVTGPTGAVGLQVVAAALVTGGVTPSFVTSNGFQPAITRIGAGQYQFTLTNPLATAADYVVTVTPRTGSPVISTVTQASGSVFDTFTASDTGSAEDSDINITVVALV